MPPKSVVKLVESTRTMSPALCSFGGIHSRQLNSLLARLGERVRTFEIDRLPREHLDGSCAPGQFIMRQMRVEVEGRDIAQEAKAVEVVEGRQRSNFVRAFHERGPKAVGVVNRNAKPLHQRARVLAKPLLARDERVAVMQIFHLTLLHVVRKADIMMGRKQETRAVPLQPFADRGDLLRRRLLFGERYGRVRTPSACRRRLECVHRSAACSRPGRCAGRRRPDGRSSRRRSSGN